jgi:hypothetical protein
VSRAAVAALVGALAAAGCGGDDSRPLIAASKTAVARGELRPSVHLFGEPVVARIDVILNRAKVDPDDVRLKTSFEPYEEVGETVEERWDHGNFTHLRYSTTLRCLGIDCIPRTLKGNASTVSQLPGDPVFLVGQQRDEKRSYQFPPAPVLSGAGAGAERLGRVVWAPLGSLSRINRYDPSVVGQGFPFVATVAPIQQPDYRISPTPLGLGLVACALALLVLPAWLVWGRRRRRALPNADRVPPLSPLERALRLVEWASRRPSVDERREALEALAFEIHAKNARTAESARRWGWSPPTPQPEQMTGLVASIRAESNSALHAERS